MTNQMIFNIEFFSSNPIYDWMVIFHFSNRWYIYIQSYHNLRLSIFEAIKIVQRCFIACTSYHFFPISKKNIRSTFEILIAPLIQYIIFPFFPFFPLSSLLATSYLICAKRRLISYWIFIQARSHSFQVINTSISM